VPDLVADERADHAAYDHGRGGGRPARGPGKAKGAARRRVPQGLDQTVLHLRPRPDVGRGEQLIEGLVEPPCVVQLAGARRAAGRVLFQAVALGRLQAAGEVAGDVLQDPGVFGHDG